MQKLRIKEDVRRAKPPNTPYLLSHHGNSQRDKTRISEDQNLMATKPSPTYDDEIKIDFG
jgi:hypothetical protein